MPGLHALFSAAGKRREGGGSLLHRLWPTLLALLTVVVIAAWASRTALVQLETMYRLAEERGAARRAGFRVANMLSLMKDVETGQRGFVITGDERFLEPHAKALELLPQARQQLLADLQGQTERIATWQRIERHIEQRLRSSAQVIALRRSMGRLLLEETALFNESKQDMDRLRQSTAELVAALNQDYLRLNDKMTQQRQLARRDALLSALAMGLLVLLSIALILRDRWLRLRAEDASAAARAGLEDRVKERTAELSEAHERIASFALEQEHRVEAEQRRIAREVHDQLGQVFTAIRLVLGQLPRGSLPADQTRAVEQALDLGIQTSRRIAADLRPPLLDDLGLAAALRHLAERLAPAGEPEFHVDCRDEAMLADDQRLCLFRIAQEACTNALKHAQARRIELGGRIAGDRYLFEIRDDGRGLIDAQRRPGSMGLLGMGERARLAGGNLVLLSPADGGTVVSVWLPLRSLESHR